jgi:hypothetical protein
MAGYQTFTSARTTSPDPVALLTALRSAVDPNAGYGLLADGTFRVKKATAWSAADITAAQLAIDGAPALTAERAAQNEVDNWPITQKALVLALIDQLNIIRANLPTPLSAIAPAQALAAVRAKAGTL